MTLLALTAFAAVIGGLMMTAQATDTNSTTTINTSTTTTTDSDSSASDTQLWEDIGNLLTGDSGRHNGHRGHGPGSNGNIEVSSEYTANVNAILEADTDVQNLISEGYNVTSINPIIKKVIEADGTVTTKATTATVILQNGTSGYATVSVDVENAKVTEIVIITRTVIDKSSS